MEQERRHCLTSRRSFLKGAAAAPGGVALAGSLSVLPKAQAEADSVAQGEQKTVACLGTCTGRCILEATMREGKLVGVKNHALPNDRARENVCQRAVSHPYQMYSDRRILYPMRRVGERGENKFERISWDDAIAEIAEKWSGYIKEYGPSSIGMFGGSGGQADDNGSAQSAPRFGYVNKLINALHINEVVCDFDSAGLEFYPAMLGGGSSAMGSDWLDLPNADHIICWASNPSEGMVGRYHNVTDAQRGGTTLTVIDPNFTLTAAKADQFVPIRPGTDGLLAIAMMRKILDAGLEDTEFLRHRSVGPFLVKDSDGLYLTAGDIGLQAEDPTLPVALEADGTPVVAVEAKDPQLSYRGEVAGFAVATAWDLVTERIRNIEYSQEDIYRLTEVPEPVVDSLVDKMVNGKTMLITAYGGDHYSNGHTFYTNVLTLLIMTGNVGGHGRGIVGAGTAFFIGTVQPDISSIVYPNGIESAYSYRIPGSYLKKVIKTGKFGYDDVTIKSLYIQGSNVLSSQAGRREWIDELLPKVDFVVVADIFHDDTTKYADLLLPVCYWWEVDRYWPSEGYMVYSEKLSEPAGESKGDLEIVNLLLEAMGHGEDAMTREEFMTAAFECPSCKNFGITWEDLKREKLIKTNEDGYVDVLGINGIGTAEQRFSFYFNGRRPCPDLPDQEWDYDRERMLYWEPPREAWFESEEAQTYPLHFISERSKFKAHTTFTYCPNLLEISPEPYVTMNPVDAEARGIGDGDYVNVFNDRGHMVSLVYLNPGTRPGIVQIDHGWQDEQFKDGHYADLTSGFSRNVVGNNCWSDCMVQVEKMDEVM